MILILSIPSVFSFEGGLGVLSTNFLGSQICPPNFLTLPKKNLPKFWYVFSNFYGSTTLYSILPEAPFFLRFQVATPLSPPPMTVPTRLRLIVLGAQDLAPAVCVPSPFEGFIGFF